MHRISFLFIMLTFTIFSCMQNEQVEVASSQMERSAYAMVIHGVAGTILKENMTVEQDGIFTMPFNSEGMYRGYFPPAEKVVKIYKDE